MAAVFALLLIALTAIAFSVLLDQDAAEMAPVTVFFITLYLYFFYCANLLSFGISSLYLLIAVLLLCAIVSSIKSKRNVMQKLTPAFVVFCCTSLFFVVYTADNYSINWDELRVWSAMPKAIYETKELQLGAGALIFDSSDNMQTYPPALPLFANFFLSASAVFVESYIFLAYAVFVSAIAVSPFRKLRWNRWWLMPFIFLFVTCAPFVLTLHGGDNSYFYESLYIDPVLGFAAGYVFYLATSRPFASKFSALRFALALSVLVIIKDTGILFAALSLLCALCIGRMEEKTPFDVLVRNILLPAGLMCICYLIWKGLLQHYHITNHVSLALSIPSGPVIGALAELLFRAPIINLVVFGFSFAVYCLILLALCFLIEARSKVHSKVNNAFSLALPAVAFLLFAFGYINIFPYASADHLLDLSYYRYFTTLTSAYLIFAFLRYGGIALEVIPANKPRVNIFIFAVSLLVCGFSTFVLSYWETDYTALRSDFINESKAEKLHILEQIPVDPAEEHKRIYLLMAEKEPNIFHHRFYFELLGSGINIENFYIDTDMYNGLGSSPEAVEETAEAWYARLQAEGYDYIYVHSTSEAFDQAFSHLGLGNAIAGQVYPVNG